MLKEIRTKRNKLIGVFNEQTRILCIKDRNKETSIEVPLCGLRLQFTLGDGKVEDVYIPPKTNKPIVA